MAPDVYFYRVFEELFVVWVEVKGNLTYLRSHLHQESKAILLDM